MTAFHSALVPAYLNVIVLLQLAVEPVISVTLDGTSNSVMPDLLNAFRLTAVVPDSRIICAIRRKKVKKAGH